MKFYVLIMLSIYCTSAISQNILLNEIMSSNDHTIADEDGEFVDWIELYNNSSLVIDLQNYKLSDDPNDLQKWSFPSITMDPFSFLLIFASGKEWKFVGS